MNSAFEGKEHSESALFHSESEDSKKNAFVIITEEPQPKALRFRYICEGRSAGSIPGVSSTSEHKTFPSIKVCNYKGHAFVVVSCVTVDAPHRPHPHNLVGKSCRDGICTMKITNDSMECMFSNLGIQCVKKKDVENALTKREDQRVDPFRTGFSHRNQSQSIDLNSVRLCFQVFLEGKDKGKFTYPLPPVVSNSIFDKKATSDLVICKLSDCTSSVLGGKEIILLCDKVAKDDIQVRFFEARDHIECWEGFGDFQASDVHRQVAISFKAPKYKDTEIENPVSVFIQLYRPSDKCSSEPLPFQYLPLDTGDVKRKIRRIEENNRDLFGLFVRDTAIPQSIHVGPSTGAIPKEIYPSIYQSFSSHVKVEPQDIILSTSPEITGANVTQVVAISPQHTTGGFVCHNPTDSPSTASNYLRATSPQFYSHSPSSYPLQMHVVTNGATDSTMRFLNEAASSIGMPPNARKNPTHTAAAPVLPQKQPQQSSIMEGNADELMEIKSAELIFRGDPNGAQIQPNDAFIASFSNSLNFEESSQTHNQLNESTDSRVASYLPNIQT